MTDKLSHNLVFIQKDVEKRLEAKFLNPVTKSSKVLELVYWFV